MSHFSRIQTQIVEQEHLLKALEDLGYSYETGDLSVRGFGGQTAKADVVVHMRLSNSIGFHKVGESYQIIADWWGVRGIKQKEFTDKISQRYAYHATRASLEQQGFSLVEETTDKGAVRLVLRRMA